MVSTIDYDHLVDKQQTEADAAAIWMKSRRRIDFRSSYFPSDLFVSQAKKLTGRLEGIDNFSRPQLQGPIS